MKSFFNLEILKIRINSAVAEYINKKYNVNIKLEYSICLDSIILIFIHVSKNIELFPLLFLFKKFYHFLLKSLFHLIQFNPIYE